MLSRLLIIGLVALFVAALVSAVWNLCDWPPPRLILKYGFPPTGGPTGRAMTIEGVEFVELKPGCFRMGSHFLCHKGDLLGWICALLRLPWGKQPKHGSEECPAHWVEIARAFWIARTETTNEQYERLDPHHRRQAYGARDQSPAHIEFEEARAYCEWLAKRCGLPVRLPSEAEWEYACRAGSTSEYSFGDSAGELKYYGVSDRAWGGLRFRSAPTSLTHGACSTCMATLPSGVSMNSLNPTMVRHVVAVRGRLGIGFARYVAEAVG